MATYITVGAPDRRGFDPTFQVMFSFILAADKTMATIYTHLCWVLLVVRSLVSFVFGKDPVPCTGICAEGCTGLTLGVVI